MATKRNPGEFDCYEAAGEDEPMFVLLARDEQSPERVRDWARKREKRMHLELAGMTDESLRRTNRKIAEAYVCADAMEVWHANELDRKRQQEESRTLHVQTCTRENEYSDGGQVTGPHVCAVSGSCNGWPRERVEVCERKHRCAEPGEGPCNGMPRPAGGFTGAPRTECCGESASCEDTRCQYMRFARGIPDGVTQHDLDTATELPPLGDSRRPRPLPRDHYTPSCTGSCLSRGCNCAPGHE